MPMLCPTLMRKLIFDIDGTLSDPMPGFSRSINHALGAPVPRSFRSRIQLRARLRTAAFEAE